ncbi:MAG: branched-chain amino acid transaminase [Candidatus Methylomirabilis sp.]|nr:branched-chain amino acid transaminase [Deltaproteobacteria bacterium]
MVDKLAKIWMDGKLVDWDDANVHILTHTLHYGMGVFEGIRCYETVDGRGAIFRLDAHIKRLLGSAHIFTMKSPYGQAEIERATIDLLKANKLTDCYIRPLIYLGDGAMGLYPAGNPIRLAIIAWRWGAYLGEEGLAQGIRMKTSSFTRHHPNNVMVKAKATGMYINSILAKMEVKACGYDEALLMDTEGCVSEASGENVFIVQDGAIYTPDDVSILKGITRDAVFRIAKDLGVRIEAKRITRDEVYLADEAFLTGTAAEVTPIRELDGRAIGAGARGPITKRIQDAFFDIVKGKDARYKEWLTYLP